jgi:hypothetical protein
LNARPKKLNCVISLHRWLYIIFGVLRWSMGLVSFTFDFWYKIDLLQLMCFFARTVLCLQRGWKPIWGKKREILLVIKCLLNYIKYNLIVQLLANWWIENNFVFVLFITIIFFLSHYNTINGFFFQQSLFESHTYQLKI